jgi:voltage-gated potassium channel
MARAQPSTQDLVLRRRSKLGPARSLAVRALLVLALCGVALVGFWLDRDGLEDQIDGHVSFIDILYFTVVTITTVGYGDIVPVTHDARLFDTFVVTPIRLFVFLIFLGTAYNFVLRRWWERLQTQMIARTLHDHYIICGFGTSGEAATLELMRKGVSCDQIVVVEQTGPRADAAVQLGVIVVRGDATKNETLLAAHVGRARAVIVTPGRDDTAALTVLSARKLNPQARITVSVRGEDNEELLAQAGADSVLNPASFSGTLLASAATGHHMLDYFKDLVSAGGVVAMRERLVAPAEVGKPLAALESGIGLRIYRGSRSIGFWEPEASRLEHGDVVVEVIPSGAQQSGAGARGG